MAKKQKTRPSESESANATQIEFEQQPPQPECQQEEVEVEPDHVQEQIEAEPEQQNNEDEEEEETENMEGDENENEKGEQEESSEDGGEEETNDLFASTGQEANGGANTVEEEELEEEPVEKILEPFSKEQLGVLVKEAFSKHPDLMELLHKLADADPAHRKIFVHGLGWDTNSDTLNSVFGKYGEIESCKAVIDKASGKSKGYAFILFKHRSGARKALKQPQKSIGNRMTSCQLASAGPVQAPLSTAPTVSEYTQRKIFVSNVSAEVDIQKLLELFSKFGEIEDGPLGLDKQTGKPKGFCIFVYKSVESAKNALEEPYKNFEGVTLHCQKAIDGPKPSKPFFQQQQHPHYQQYHPHSSKKEKNKYSAGGGAGPGHLMAPIRPSMAFNPAIGATPALGPALGQALTALLATQGAGLGLNNLLGGLLAPMNQGIPQVVNSSAGYASHPGDSYVNQQVMQGGYPNPQMGQGGAGRHQTGGGVPYMGHGY